MDSDMEMEQTLDYLSLVRKRFRYQTGDIHNKLLTAITQYRLETLDIPHIILRVAQILDGHPDLIEEFKMLLPEGYRIQCSPDPNNKMINVIVPIHEPLPQTLYPNTPNAMAMALSQNIGVDAKLRYYEFVKTQFEEQPSVSITFFDIMKEYREERIDTPTVIQRITDLFGLYPALLTAFNIFLPPGYEIVPPKLPSYTINFFHAPDEMPSQGADDDAMMAD
ncbi:hypothetical protein CVT24_012579 [Panaeolus cyanescens]|uniref:Uncharacterized protein n=1 Tax=Panaeolus cyanescens TaxID=181874 RepID=A0A409YJV4_9AGAR|nr:hypothetical protein CVT24_012579 [Panaeolus cyanescens]